MDIHEEQSRRLDDCLQQMITDGLLHAGEPVKGRGVVTGWTCYVQFIDGEGKPSWATIVPAEQGAVMTAGQVRHLDEMVGRGLRAMTPAGEV